MWTKMIFKSVESKLFAFANRKQAWRDRRNNTRYGAGGTASGATTHWISSSATNMTMPGRKRSDALRINFTGTRQPGRGLHKQQRRQGSPSRKIREQPHIRRARGLQTRPKSDRKSKGTKQKQCGFNLKKKRKMWFQKYYYKDTNG